MTRIIPYDLIKHLEWTPGQAPPPRNEPPLPATNALPLGVFTLDALVNSGKPFYSTKVEAGKNIGVVDSLEQAISYIGDTGVIASLPYLVAGKASADAENYLWKTWFTALSEENVGIDKKGLFVKKGKPVIITVHGGGILTASRIKQAYAEGLTSQNAAKYSDEEFAHLLEGVLPSGESIQIYAYDDVKNGRIPNPFGRYAVALDFERAKPTPSGLQTKEIFMENPLVHVRVGTLDHLESYSEKAKSGSQVGNWHRLAEINAREPQGRILFVYYDFIGLIGDNDLYDYGRFVGVAPEAPSAKK